MSEMVPELSARELSDLLGPWRTSGGTLSIGLATAIAHLIDAERLSTGTRLPAQRALATELNLSRGTVTTAYEILSGGGYVTAEVGRGSTVSMNRRRLRQHRSAQAGGTTPISIDLSTQSLPAAPSLTKILDLVTPSALRPYLETDGHTAYGLPVTRAAIARHLTVAGSPTTMDEILVTAGAQQALWLTVFAMTEPGDTVVVEEPTYRGILAVLGGVQRGLRVEGYPAGPANLDAGSVSRAQVVYVQSSVHSPTGQVWTSEMLRHFATVVNSEGVLVIDDRSAADLVYDPDMQNTGLTGLIPPERLVTVGTMSKLFWGGLRIGWIRGHPHTIARMADLKQTMDVTTSIVDQFLTVEALDTANIAASQRRQLLVEHVESTIRVVREVCPGWEPATPSGGSGLWVDTGSDAIEYAMRAQARGVRIADGPSFSASHGFETHVRLPVWNATDDLRRALEAMT